MDSILITTPPSYWATQIIATIRQINQIDKIKFRSIEEGRYRERSNELYKTVVHNIANKAQYFIYSPTYRWGNGPRETSHLMNSHDLHHQPSDKLTAVIICFSRDPYIFLFTILLLIGGGFHLGYSQYELDCQSAEIYNNPFSNVEVIRRLNSTGLRYPGVINMVYIIITYHSVPELENYLHNFFAVLFSKFWTSDCNPHYSDLINTIIANISVDHDNILAYDHYFTSDECGNLYCAITITPYHNVTIIINQYILSLITEDVIIGISGRYIIPIFIWIVVMISIGFIWIYNIYLSSCC